MSTPFNARQGLIVVEVRLFGPAGDRVARLALDTGATATMINQTLLIDLGYDPATAPERVGMTTGSGVEQVPRLPVNRIEALGQERTNLPILCHTLPPSAAIDGPLGLDFLRGQELTINFRTGQITLR